MQRKLEINVSEAGSLKGKLQVSPWAKPALFIGRFQPFHLGHLDALRQILKKEGRVFICIGSSQEAGTAQNPFSFERRRLFIKKITKELGLNKKVKIYACPDIHNNKKWVAHVSSLLPAFGPVYTGSALTAKLFRADHRPGRAGKKHPVYILKKRLHISGTVVRKKIRHKEKWSHLVPRSIISFIKNGY